MTTLSPEATPFSAEAELLESLAQSKRMRNCLIEQAAKCTDIKLSSALARQFQQIEKHIILVIQMIQYLVKPDSVLPGTPIKNKPKGNSTLFDSLKQNGLIPQSFENKPTETDTVHHEETEDEDDFMDDFDSELEDPDPSNDNRNSNNSETQNSSVTTPDLNSIQSNLQTMNRRLFNEAMKHLQSLQK